MYFCTSINIHFTAENKSYVNILSNGRKIKSIIVIMLRNQKVKNSFRKLTNEKKCAIIAN